MKTFRKGQGGFAAPAMFIAVIVAFLGSMNVKTDDGITLASKMGLGGERAAFAAVETAQPEQAVEQN